MVTTDQVAALARTVRVELAADELAPLRDELAHMLAFAADLQTVDVTGVPEWTPPPPTGRPLRADVVAASLPRTAARGLAPTEKDGYFQVPRTLEDG